MRTRYELLSEDGRARRGRLHTIRGVVETPQFMPVGTQGTVKGIDVERLKVCGATMILANTYHLLLRPGPERIAALGGIHRFTGWEGPILSDSGGFQVFSLTALRKLTEDGVTFRSHLDGREIHLSPETSIATQEQFGVTVAMAFDECPPADGARELIAAAVARTNRWARRSLAARTREDVSLFGITQGAGDRELRTQSAEDLSTLPFDGMAIGGLSVGEPTSVMYDVLSYHPTQLPRDKVRYLMGVGTPRDIVEAVGCGVDLFDCVMPTRSGRTGRAYLSTEPFINIRNARFATDEGPLDPHCSCLACRRHSRAYLHHLFRCEEMLGPILLSIHNVHFYLALMQDIREAIAGGRFTELRERYVQLWKEEIREE